MSGSKVSFAVGAIIAIGASANASDVATIEMTAADISALAKASSAIQTASAKEGVRNILVRFDDAGTLVKVDLLIPEESKIDSLIDSLRRSVKGATITKISIEKMAHGTQDDIVDPKAH